MDRSLVDTARRFVAALIPCAAVLTLGDVAALAGAADAGTGGDAFADANEAARQTANPLGGDFVILLNQFDNYFQDGDATDDVRNLNSWSFQPVLPLPMEDVVGDNWILVTRPTFPVILNADIPDAPNFGMNGGERPVLPPAFKPPGGFPPGGLPFRDKGGFGDIVLFSLLGQSLPQDRWGGGDLVWGVGPTWQFPSASRDEFGSGKWSVGPSAVAASIGKDFILGGLFQQWFSFADGGKGLGETVNYSWLNIFYFLNFANGWQVGGTPIITADWKANTDNRWTVPLGLGVFKTHFFGGKLPVKMGVEMQWMPVQPDFLGQKWNLRFVVAPVLPSPFGSFTPP